MKKLAVLLLVIGIMVCPALADQEKYCDPVPDTLVPMLDAAPRDCVALTAPDGTPFAFVISDDDMLCGYRLTDGQWECVHAGTALEGHSDTFLQRSGEDAGFRVCSPDRCEIGYGWDGSAYYTVSGWRDPARYNGAVRVNGTSLCYTPEGGSAPAYMVDVGDPLRLYGWISDFAGLPATPEEAKARAAILPDAICADFDGYLLAEYNDSDNGRQAEAVFARVRDGELQCVRASYQAGKGRLSTAPLLPVPLSERLRAVPADALWQDFDAVFCEPDAFDAARLPLDGRVISLDLQQEQLVLLTEEDDGRRVVIVTKDGAYHAASSLPLPADTGLDTFHAGKNEIQIMCENQAWGAGFFKNAAGEWRLSWAMGEDVDYNVNGCGVWYAGYADGAYIEGSLIGDLPHTNLLTDDLSAIPHALNRLTGAVDASGWAAVRNPRPEDRLNLRTKAQRSADSYGKFYNGSPVRVLETSGGWCRVRIGNSDLTGWMVSDYLAFGSQANDVTPAFPALQIREAYQNRDAWADRTRKTPKAFDFNGSSWKIAGIADDLYILLSDAGDIAYAPMDWFWEGNG